jgi:hypothetical protein
MKTNPALQFYLNVQGEIEKIPEDVTGIHLLSKYLLNRFLVERSFETTTQGKFQFLKEILSADINKRIPYEEAVPALAFAISSQFDIRKSTAENTLKVRDSKHVQYGIKKELEAVWENFS